MVEPDSGSRTLFALPSKLWQHTWWKIVIVLMLGLAAGIALLAIITLFARPLALLFIAFCIAAALLPLVERLAKRIPRNLSIILIYALLLVFLLVVAALLLRPFVSQLGAFGERLPEVIDRVSQFLTENQISQAQVESLTSQLASVGQNLIAVPFAVVSSIFDAVLVLIVSIYLLMDGPQIRQFILSLFGGELRERVSTVGKEMVLVAGGYVRGVAINIVLVSIITTVGLGLIGLPFALVLGVLTGLFETLPVVGSLIAAVPIMAIALLQSPTTALITLIFVLIVQQVQGNVIAPNIMKTQAEVPRFIVPLAVLAGGIVGGVLGALIAVPLVAVMRVFLLRVIVPFIRKQTGALDEQ